MSHMKVASFEELRERVRARQKQASQASQGIAVPDTKDPAYKGNASAPSTQVLDGETRKDALPDNKQTNKNNGEGGQELERANVTEATKQPSPMDPNKLPTTDLFRKKAQNVVQSLQNKHGLNVAHQQGTKQADQRTNADSVASDMDEFTYDFHVKLASHLLSTEAGREVVRNVLSDSMAADAVDNLIKNASAMEAEAYAQAQEEEEFMQQLKSAMDAMTPEERDSFIKSANFHHQERNRLGSEIEKQAYDQGAMDAAVMEMQGGVPPIPHEEDDVTLEEIVMILDALVQSGQLDPTVAQGILEELLALAGEMPEEKMPYEKMPQGAPKSASADCVNNVVNDVFNQ